MRPNSPPQTTSVSSSRPRCFRSLISAAQAWSVSLALAVDLLGQIAVLVPAAMQNLHDAHAALDQPAGQQAAVRRRCRARCTSGPYMSSVACDLLGEVGEFRHAGLHAEGHLVLRDARLRFGIAEALRSLR